MTSYPLFHFEHTDKYRLQQLLHAQDYHQSTPYDVKKIFLHQANEKLDEAVLKYFYKQFNKEIPENIMPISVDIYGNSSVATIPTLYDEVLKTKFKGHNLKKGDVILFASVGAGMNINALTYQL